MILLIYALNSVYFAFPLSSHKLSYVNLTISEQGGNRPVAILQNNVGNHYSTTTIVAAFTTAYKKHWLPTHVRVDCDFLERESIILLEQIRTIDKRRLGNYVGEFGADIIKSIDQALKISFGITFLEGLIDE